MVGRRVERVEAVIFIFDLRSVGHRKANFAKAAEGVLGHLRERMKLAQWTATAWQCKVGRLFRQGGLEFERTAAVREGGFEFYFGRIDGFASTRFLLLGQSSKLFHQRRESAM